jgi:hypothetical protein
VTSATGFTIHEIACTVPARAHPAENAGSAAAHARPTENAGSAAARARPIENAGTVLACAHLSEGGCTIQAHAYVVESAGTIPARAPSSAASGARHAHYGTATCADDVQGHALTVGDGTWRDMPRVSRMKLHTDTTERHTVLSPRWTRATGIAHPCRHIGGWLENAAGRWRGTKCCSLRAQSGRRPHPHEVTSDCKSCLVSRYGTWRAALTRQRAVWATCAGPRGCASTAIS